jgi:hypothetical protein
MNPRRKPERATFDSPANIIANIRPGDRVTARFPNGKSIDWTTRKTVQDYAERTGTAVMRSSVGGWVLNMGGRFGTPGLVDEHNVVSVRKAREPRRRAA